MKTDSRSSQSGIALIIVMICVAVLAMLAAAFAYRMNVENRLVRNANAEANFYALAQSGVDYCKSVLVATANEPEEVWNGTFAGSTSNGIINLIQAKNYTETLGNGRFTFNITNLESYANINSAEQPMLEQAMRLMGVDAGDSGPIVASILDWISPSPNALINGTPSDYYESLDPPYKAKDGFMDDISELWLVRGMEAVLNASRGADAPPPPPSFREQLGLDEPPARLMRPEELFTTLSTGQININSASPEVLQLIPFVDKNIADSIIWFREGQDTGQRIPFRSVDELINVPGLNGQVIPQMKRYCTTRCSTFVVHIKCEIDGVLRDYVAVLRRDQRNVQVLTFHWKQHAP